MSKMKHLKWLLLLPAFLNGCTTLSITNLTPSSLPRNADGLYPVEMAYQSNQQTLRRDDIKPYVVVGFDFYPMQRTLNMKNRWETLIPIPPGQTVVRYSFKMDYEYNEFRGHGQGSTTTPEYSLNVKD